MYKTKNELDAALYDAYEIGSKIAVKQSDVADTIMYGDASSPVVEVTPRRSCNSLVIDGYKDIPILFHFFFNLVIIRTIVGSEWT